MLHRFEFVYIDAKDVTKNGFEPILLRQIEINVKWTKKHKKYSYIIRIAGSGFNSIHDGNLDQESENIGLYAATKHWKYYFFATISVRGNTNKYSYQTIWQWGNFAISWIIEYKWYTMIQDWGFSDKL